MHVLLLSAQKGGAGKTTLAAALGVAAAEAGERVFLIDCDPQGSLAAWGGRREAETPHVDRATSDKLEGSIASLSRAGYTLVIIDTQGADTASATIAMRLADLTIIPARPSILDIEAARPTVGALTRLGRQFAFCLNQAPAGRTLRPADASRALGLLGALAQPVITLRADHLDAMALGLGVTEHSPSGKAAEEIRALWDWIKRRMGNG